MCHTDKGSGFLVTLFSLAQSRDPWEEGTAEEVVTASVPVIMSVEHCLD